MANEHCSCPWRKSNTVALAFNAPMPVLNDQRLHQRAAQLQALYEIEFVDFLRDLMRYNAMVTAADGRDRLS